ncbi:MAG TPA: type VI secretion system baseplate subunit TssE [Rhodospirillaceae bacterium]|nr:type VI secretion system baseplate subunit TssE [Rhodospirillaceae bacterium]MAX62954.1 type VI secretion system baseplate subunit TssE [Rhodospirillaceae bacterium]MBB57801.1 type VI secretion system baseplate subunit TssE [Rhodospirillaceae bacterium]HAE00305.1 type VI secretion system baseplate subunit TssE [Rhodospirillaceae bacterium]HAJ21053.1 type VI secretion system baseplate subunit TssE [Rhodospirillaceae bacterium]|tara:strand:+ start:15079 stop:15552 length:474 start_codon:yes stop_codon:yes gene_type:complete
MRSLRTKKGALAPLFDRLTDDDPGVPNEPVPRRYLDLDGLVDSVRGEIHTLLNTRCGWSESEIDYDNRGVPDYGLIDLAHLFTANPRDRDKVARHVARTIAAYEPRMTRVNVVVESIQKETGQLSLRIEGGVKFADVIEPISFPLKIDGGGHDGSGY